MEVIEMKALSSHLVITKDKEKDLIHIHGDIENKPLMRDFIEAAVEEIGVNLRSAVLDKKEIVFHNRQRIGDMLMFTCGVRDFKKAYPDVRVNVISTAGHIWDYNPNIDRSIVPTEENTFKIGPTHLTNASNRIDWHFANAFRVAIEDALNIHIPQGESKADVYFTQEEYNEPRVIKDPYWIICVNGELGWGCKMYPIDRWQTFVNQNPDITFVQIGAQEDNPPRLQGSNVIDYVGKTQSKQTGIRDLFKLFLNAEGSIGLVSFHMHLSGALDKPCIVVAGGREPVSFTRYPGHRYLSTDGCLPCSITACWHCAIETCHNFVIDNVTGQKVPQCVNIIQPEELTHALNQYYIGGRLKKGVPSQKPKLKNHIVATPPKKEVTIPIGAKAKGQAGEPTVKQPINTYGMSFGGGSLTDRDWEFISHTINEYKIISVLEFGAGLSTLLFNDIPGLKVITFETNQGWIDKIQAINPKCDIRLWNGKDVVMNPEHPENKYNFDLVFVDGPAGDFGRESSTEFSAIVSDKAIIVHDAGREWAKKYQDKFIAPDFNGPIKGGHRCHLWLRKRKSVYEKNIVVPSEDLKSKPGIVEALSPIEKPDNPGIDRKFIKVVSTARGWGGCARSVTTIMKLMLKSGHKVEFIPFRNSVGSKEYQDCIKNELPGLIVTENYDTVRESCDVLFMYADDYVWEFNQTFMNDVFSEIGAERKIMMLNYRRGNVGQISWTRDWDKYMFLNSTQEKELLKVHPGVKTKVLPPCTDLTEFFMVKPDFTHFVIVRHSSQGDTKFEDPTIVSDQIAQIQTRPDVGIMMLPGPSLVQSNDRFIKVPRTSNPNVIAKFLSGGNLFWYSLPKGYMDMGPRVILEAMAAGLPILADNWGGAIDRVTPECGWLCSTKEEQIKIIQNVTLKELKEKGGAARERAHKEFVPERYLEEVINVKL